MDATDAPDDRGRTRPRGNGSRAMGWPRRAWAVLLRGPHVTVRMRLALLCSALVVMAGALVLAATYFLLNPPVRGLYFRAPATVAVRFAGSSKSHILFTPSTHATAAKMRACAAAMQQALARLPASASAVGPIANPAPGPAALVVLRCLNLAAASAGGPGRTAAVQAIVGQVSTAQQALDLRRLLMRGALALAVLAALALFAGWWVAGRILRPLQVMTERVQQLSGRSPFGRIALTGPDDELRRLADTFDGLLARLDSALAADRTFIANASHELRTPLAIQETVLDVALSDPAADVQSLRTMAERLRAVNGRSRRLIEGLLSLARSQQGPDRWEPVDLAAVTAAAADAAAPEARARGVRLERRLQPATARGDPDLLERLAGNLVENAVRHNTRGGWAQVRTEARGGWAVLTVDNAGPRVADADVPALFEPFRRGARARTDSHRGAGLGLSIVRAVATAHAGHVRAVPRTGGGLTVTVELPMAPMTRAHRQGESIAGAPRLTSRPKSIPATVHDARASETP